MCRLYEGDDRDDPVAVIEKEVHIKKPFTFTFSGLKPETGYTAMINGICKYNVIHRTAKFVTKSENITSFRMMILSCDRPGKLDILFSTGLPLARTRCVRQHFQAAVHFPLTSAVD